jgi:hypothetical protein
MTCKEDHRKLLGVNLSSRELVNNISGNIIEGVVVWGKQSQRTGAKASTRSAATTASVRAVKSGFVTTKSTIVPGLDGLDCPEVLQCPVDLDALDSALYTLKTLLYQHLCHLCPGVQIPAEVCLGEPWLSLSKLQGIHSWFEIAFISRTVASGTVNTPSFAKVGNV